MDVYWKDMSDTLPGRVWQSGTTRNGTWDQEASGRSYMEFPQPPISFQPISPCESSPLLSRFLLPNSGGLLAPPTLRHQAARGVTSLPKNWLPSGTNLTGGSHSFSVTPILLNSPWHTGPQEEGVSPLDQGKGCTSSRNKDALQAPWG